MIDVKEIMNTIEDLENGPTTFATCARLADLYTIMDHLEIEEDNEE